MKSSAKSAKVKEGAKPDFLDLDKDGNKKEPMKKAAKDAKVKENFDGDRNADQDTPSRFNKKKTSTGTVHTKKSKEFDKDSSDSGKKDTSHLQGMLGGAPKAAVKGRVHKMKEGMKHPKDCDCKECAMMERDEGKHNNGKTTGFKAVAKKAAKEYGSKAAGERVAGAVRAKMAKAGKLEESQFKHNVRFVNESLEFYLAEDEEAKAKTITAAGDIVNDYTSWMQRVGQYQTKALIELADSIRADFGQEQAEAFKQVVAPALSATLETLTQQREAISNAVAGLAGGGMPAAPMGADPMAGGMPGEEPGLDIGAPDAMNPGDEFGASDAAVGGPETAGRGLRESRRQRTARRLAEAHSIIARLAK